MPMVGLNPTDTTWNHITRRAADAGRTDIIRQVKHHCPDAAAEDCYPH